MLETYIINYKKVCLNRMLVWIFEVILQQFRDLHWPITFEWNALECWIQLQLSSVLALRRLLASSAGGPPPAAARERERAPRPGQLFQSSAVIDIERAAIQRKPSPIAMHIHATFAYSNDQTEMPRRRFESNSRCGAKPDSDETTYRNISAGLGQSAQQTSVIETPSRSERSGIRGVTTRQLSNILGRDYLKQYIRKGTRYTVKCACKTFTVEQCTLHPPSISDKK